MKVCRPHLTHQRTFEPWELRDPETAVMFPHFGNVGLSCYFPQFIKFISEFEIHMLSE